MEKLLTIVDSPADVKKLSTSQLQDLSEEIRQTLIESILHSGGHLGSNLGVIEATVALHYVFNSPEDKLIFDVSHQSYTHKILTGRKRAYTDMAHYGEVCGFQNPHESQHDSFELGHTSTSISLAVGCAKAFQLQGNDASVVAVIGDGSLSGGEAFEGLDQAADLKRNLVIVVNDNEMSIAPNQGGIYRNLDLLRKTKGKAECNLFKAMGLDYQYVDDGHDMAQLIGAFNTARNCPGACVVHIHTQKGKGLPWAEADPEASHKVGKGGSLPACPEAGSMEAITTAYLEERMATDDRLLLVSAATPRANGFSPEFREKAGSHFVDVGIAEEHAVGYVSGAAKMGAHALFAVYSTFIQRSYDQLMQDLSLNQSPATILIYRSGIEGGAATHAGIYDIAMIGNIPGITCIAPATVEAYLSALEWSLNQTEKPVVIRVPRTVLHEDQLDALSEGDDKDFQGTSAKTWSHQPISRLVQKGQKVALYALGTCMDVALKASKLIEAAYGFTPTIVDPVYYSGLDGTLLDDLTKTHEAIITLEDGIVEGGFGSKVAQHLAACPTKAVNLGLPKDFFDYVSKDDMKRIADLTPDAILEQVGKVLD